MFLWLFFESFSPLNFLKVFHFTIVKIQVLLKIERFKVYLHSGFVKKRVKVNHIHTML